MSFITLEDAKIELRIDDDSQDEYIEKLVERTDTAILGYLDFDDTDAFFYEYGEGAKKDLVEVAAAMVLHNLYDNAGGEVITQPIKDMLRPVRAPRVG